MVKIAIVEDDKASQESLNKHLMRYSNEKAVQLELHFFDNGLDFLDGYGAGYDIVLMDIEMPHLDGIETSKKLREIDGSVCLIFITNMVNHAVSGYEVEAMYFIIKPIQYLNFSVKLDKAVRVSNERGATIPVKSVEGVSIVRVSDIYYLEVENNIVKYHTAAGIISEYNSLTNVEKSLGGLNFARCNNCYLVNLRYVSGVKDNNVQVAGESLLMSRNRKKAFVDALTRCVK